jgi:hypothetical protein
MDNATLAREGKGVHLMANREQIVFNLTVSFGEKQWQFLFNSIERAKMVLRMYEEYESNGAFITIVDDYGNTALLDVARIDGMLVEKDFFKKAKLRRGGAS